MLLTAWLNLVLEKIQETTRREGYILLSLIFIMVVLINGIGLVPPEHYQRLSQNPFVTRTDIDSNNYWQETVLLPIVAFYTQLTSRLTFNILCGFIILLGYLLYAQFVFRKYGSVEMLVFTTILITNPLTTVLLSWLGTPDGLTFVLTIPFLFINSLFFIFFLAVLGTMNHTAFIIAASEILLLRWIAADKIKTLHMIFMVLGGIMGRILVNFFLMFNGIQITPSRLGYILSLDLNTWIVKNIANFPVTIFSFFNIQWLIIFVSVIMFFKRDKIYYVSLLIILVFNYGVAFFTEDTTRVFALLSWGILMMCIFHSYELSLDIDTEISTYHKQYLLALIVVGMTSLITPRYFSWRTSVVMSPFNEFVRKIGRHFR